ncbi:Clp1/GlmU family protein [Stetteria hydrogenophila]
MRVRVDLDAGEALRVFGPARVVVEGGLVSLLGAELVRGDVVDVDEYRSYLLKALEPSSVTVSLSGEGRLEAPVEGEVHYDSWLEAAESVIEGCGGPCRVVVGPVDAGKTSFAAMLSNRALARGLIPAVIDADVGQADIGPPGFVALGVPDSWVAWLRSLDPVDLRFIGSIEPGPVAGRIISSTALLAERARRHDAGVVVVDTDGWVEGWQALEFKADLARALDADYVVVVGSEELAGYMRRATAATVHSIPSPEAKAERDRRARRELRSRNYARFLRGAEVAVNLRRVPVQGSCLFTGEPVDGKLAREAESTLGLPVLAASRYPGGVCVAVDSPEPPDQGLVRQLQRRLGGEVIVVYTGGFRGILAALTDGEGVDWPAMLLDVDLETGEAVFQTRHEVDARRVTFGRLKLDPEKLTEEVRGRILI